MTDSEKMTMVQTIVQDSSSEAEPVLASYLQMAMDAIMTRLYPFAIPDDASLPSRYDMLQCRIAGDMYLRRGAEGETVHIENNIHRTYRSTDWEELLKYVTPYAEVM